MPEEIKLSHQDSSVYSDHSDGDASRSENSSCFDESGYCKQNGHETVEIIPTRTLKTSVPKPAANPLQFVKIGPCDLYRSAQQQLQKVSEIKKPKKEVKDEMEDWQSNLDSWKCNRRKQQEHIIERVVEVKKLELEEHDRNRKRTKTFSEMMEERTSKGRKLSLPLYLEEDNDDFSDLGISSSKSGVASSIIPEETDNQDENDENDQNNNCGNYSNNSDQIRENGGEATYESAIQSYEIRMKSLTNGECKKLSPTSQKFSRRGSAAKIEEKLSELERIKNRSVSNSDLTETNKKHISIPKVNIFERKEMFEKISDANDSCKSRKPNDDHPSVRSIKERLSSLEKQTEDTTNKSKNILLTEVSVKDRLSSINEKIRQQHVLVTVSEKPVLINSDPLPVTKLSSVDFEKEHRSKEYSMYNTGIKTEEVVPSGVREYSSSGRSSSSEDYEHVHHQVNHFHHRSLDSLHGHDSPNGFCFERVQSLECIDCCSNYPASVLSGDTDREDSGIHTADVSSSVSQADDFDLHPDSSIDVNDIKTQHTQTITKVEKSSHNHDFCFISQNNNGSLEDVGEEMDVDNKHEHNQNKSEHESRNSIEAEVKDHFDGERDISRDTVFEVEHCFIEDETVVDRKSELRTDNDIIRNNDYDGVSNNVEEKISCVNTKSENVDVCDNVVEIQNSSNFVISEDCKSTMRVESDCCDNNLNENEIVPPLNEDNFNKSPMSQTFIENENNYVCDNTTEQKKEPDHSNNSDLTEDMMDSINKSESVFAFESSTAVEPPKEKPPPPPSCNHSDDEYDGIIDNGSLTRMDSTKRIKKEIRQKRSSFLGIESFDDDSYLEPELESVKRPPDMTTFLQEERRLEKLLYRQSICSESDSTQGESRDSGVELDKNQLDEGSWITDDVHSRQDSETYANTSTTSEEDEIIKKEREILEILELEEQRHYNSETKNECNNLGEKLVLKLQELERQKNVNWNREEEQNSRDQRIANSCNYQIYEEPLIEIKRPVHEANPTSDSMLLQQQWTGRSLQDVTQETNVAKSEYRQPSNTHDYRSSMPNIQQELIVSSPYHRVPPPIPPNKPAHFREPAPVNKVSNPQQMSRQTLQALSAVPRSKIITTDSWVLSKKKPRQEICNYQHWLIQEAEHRRITEYQQRYNNDNVPNNYVNVHTDYSESAMLKTVQNQESRISGHQNRSLYAHPQMLPHRNYNQTYNHDKNHAKSQHKPLPDSVIQTLTQRVQNRLAINDTIKQRRREPYLNVANQQEKMLSVSGKKKCSHCGEELGRGAAMIIESLRLFYHINCFKCCVCCVQLGDGLMGTDVRVRNSKLHCHSCYSNDEGLKFSCV